MGRRVHLSWMVVAATVVGACSGDGGTFPSTSAQVSTSSSPAAATPRPAPTASTPPAVAPDGPPSPPTSSGASEPTTSASTDARGWRFEVRTPVAGASIPRRTTMCFEVTGPSREPDVAFDVAWFAAGSTAARSSERVEGSVGRGSVEVDAGEQATGPHELHVQLIVDGEAVEGASRRIPVVLVDGGPSAATCT